MNIGRAPAEPETVEPSAPRGRTPEGIFVWIVRWWLILSALVGLAGWTLSGLGQLNRTGYTIFFLVAAVFLVAGRKAIGAPAAGQGSCWGAIRRRFRRPLPGAFAVLACLIFLGSVYYPPSNYTGLAYRVGRVLQWLDHGHWWWIHTPDNRMNDRACGAEWWYTPIVLFTNSDRALFLVNFVPYLLLPGLIFSVFTRLGVRARAAWHWMWLIPTGYDFLLQAGSIANDTFPTAFGLAAIDFILRARASRRVSDLWYSLIAAALLTGAKASNLPLLLPWAILGLDMAPLLKRRLAATAAIVVVAVMVSFAPTAILNSICCGQWSGANLELPRMKMEHPWTGIWGNAFQLGLDNFAPPLFPMAGWWNTHAHSLLPHFVVYAAEKEFNGDILYLGEMPTEDWTGIGLGLSLLVVVSVVGGLGLGKTQPKPRSQVPTALRRGALAGAWVALMAYCVESGMENAARLIAPYYPLLLASLLTGAGQSEIVRRLWWRRLAGMTVVLAFIVLALLPDRPLWPAQTILSKLSGSGWSMVGRAREVYSIYAHRWDALAGVRAMLPQGIKTVGLVAGADDNDVPLWRPFGSRRVEHFLVTDPPGLLRSRVQYVLVGGWNLSYNHLTIDDWLRNNDAEIIATTNATVKISEGSRTWYLTRLKG